MILNRARRRKEEGRFCLFIRLLVRCAFLLSESDFNKGETVVTVVILRDKEDQRTFTELVGKHTERFFGETYTGITHRRMQYLENHKLQRFAFAHSCHLLCVLELL